MVMIKEMQNESELDIASRFWAQQYVSQGYYLHFHRNIEIYGVVHGTVSVTVAGEQQELTDGQFVVIDGLAHHSYEIDGEAEVIYFHIGTRYCNKFYSLYPRHRMPYFLMDVEYNKKIYDQIHDVIGNMNTASELRRIGIVCQLFSDIIDHYGIVEKLGNIGTDHDIITQVIQYIYDHYNEHITLESLSKVFYISPKALSKKISKRLNMDLRLYINDIRIQRAVQMRDDPQHEDKPLYEIATLCGFTNMGTFYRSYERNFRFRKLEKE